MENCKMCNGTGVVNSIDLDSDKIPIGTKIRIRSGRHWNKYKERFICIDCNGTGKLI